MFALNPWNVRGVAALALAGMLAVVAGCNGDGDSPSAPTATPTPTATSSVTTTATPTATPSATHSASPSATASPTATNTATPEPTVPFTVHGSVEQLFITDSEAGTSVALLDGSDAVVRQGTTDDQGALIFRDLPAGDGYRVRVDIGGRQIDSAAVRVTAFDEPAPESFYSEQQLAPGYGYLTTRDGTKLAVNVVLPTGKTIEDGPFPTVVEYSGYDPANPSPSQPGILITSNVGYAAVGVNIRGTGCSGGAFNYFERVQSTDGYDVIEIVAAQPWVKGNKVGMVGISYPGISQLFTAQTQPPHLAAITPLSVISDSARGILSPGGILNNGFAVDWISQRQDQAVPFGQAWAAKRRDEGDQVCIANQRLRGQNVDMVQLIHDNPYYVPELVGHLVPADFVHRINVPVFLAGAWQDEQTGGYFPTMLDRFTGTDKVHFTMTNGLHVDSLDPAIFVRWLEFLSLYVREEVPERPFTVNGVLQVFAQEIFGVPRVTVEAPRFNASMTYEEALAKWESEQKVRILFENGAGTPIIPGSPIPTLDLSFDAWPIPELQPTSFYLADNGALQSTPPGGEQTDSYIYDASRSQRLTYSGGGESIWKALPTYDWPSPEVGKALSYATEPLEQTLVMAGSGSVDLWLQSTAADTDLQVTLTEIRPDGKEFYVQSGWLRASFRKVADGASVLRPFHSGLEEDNSPLPSGEFSLARVELFPFAHIFRTGSRIRLIIDAPGASRPIWKFDALQPDETVINTIAHSAALPSRIVLPVIPDITVTKPFPPCPSLRGQPCRTYEELSNTPPSRDNELRLNQIQVLGSHNSYHIQPRPEVMAFFRRLSADLARGVEYTHLPLDEQFSNQGIRQIELDVWADPDGGKFRDPRALRLTRLPPPDVPELLEPGFKVLHIQDLDFVSTCYTFVSCLETIKAWSDAHPHHLPIMILVEAKDDELPGNVWVVPIPIRAAQLDALDAEIRSVLPPSQLITPDDVRGSHDTLEEAILTDGWPTLAESRGKILFALDNEGIQKTEYLRDHPSLRGRILFTSSRPGAPESAFIKLNSSIGDFEEIRRVVADGYIVRTRADADTEEARSNDTRARDAALSSGAQFVSTDYPVPNLALSSYRVTIPGGAPARCNPISAPPECTSLEVENPSAL